MPIIVCRTTGYHSTQADAIVCIQSYSQSAVVRFARSDRPDHPAEPGAPMLLGFDEAMVRTGTMAFNPALTAIGLGGFFIVLSARTTVYALLGAVLSIWMFIALSAILAQVGLPAMTIGMVIAIALLVLGAHTFGGMRVVPPEQLRRAERWLRDPDGRGEATT